MHERADGDRVPGIPQNAVDTRRAHFAKQELREAGAGTCRALRIAGQAGKGGQGVVTGERRALTVRTLQDAMVVADLQRVIAGDLRHQVLNVPI